MKMRFIIVVIAIAAMPLSAQGAKNRRREGDQGGRVKGRQDHQR
jgi:hypothetical protein